MHLVSDLHLEFGPITLAGGDTLLLAGDICVADLLRPERTDKEARKHRARCNQFFFEECAKYDRVFYIMGNHEHYNGVFDHTADIIREFIACSNVQLVVDEFVDLSDQYRLFGGTLWTDYNKNDFFCVHAAKDMMNDHQCIKKMSGDTPRTFVPADAMDIHHRTMDKLRAGLNDEDSRDIIVMSHHAPHFRSIEPRYHGSALNGAYYTDLENFILDNPRIKTWVHGHVHHRCDYRIGHCQVACNPRGYYGYEINSEFNPQFIIGD